MHVLDGTSSEEVLVDTNGDSRSAGVFDLCSNR